MNKSHELVIIADDLTGANDSGIQLAKKGRRATVFFNAKEAIEHGEDVTILDTDSRAITPSQAYQCIASLMNGLKTKSPLPHIYKKIDSTLRGNLGAEIQALYDSRAFDVVIIAPAYPKAGRKTKAGFHYVQNQLLHHTEVSRDPKTPVLESHIPTLLTQQLSQAVGHIQPALYKDESQWELEINRLRNTSPFIVSDANDDEELQRLAMLQSSLPLRTLWVGSAGLIEMLYDHLFNPLEVTKVERKLLPTEGQTLIVSGSASTSTAKQIEQLKRDSDIQTLPINMTHITTNTASISDYVNELDRMLWNKQHVLLIIEEVPEQTKNISNIIVKTLAVITAHGVASGQVINLILTGGDTAKAVVTELGVKGITLLKEIEDGIPLGQLIGDPPCTIITKAGAYGNQHSLVHAYNYLKSRDKTCTNQ
ncbi:four-carbon acid sugar kinase family protein [Geomicrobium sediminis]|uniref:Uncharacterized protein YgbK (DUF1537 family) n=1 Tax=Geomicrobium sediminis TaxID=1347788 RepID=A0ABS2PAF1_9BACL|nr:four-carbon acid sugar kinase family protein [Geomicrobium sediminis]MBM7632277.1 uncharacterized protein YgbK (DUF1537 family) [Geomicrobium sediminis]